MTSLKQYSHLLVIFVCLSISKLYVYAWVYRVQYACVSVRDRVSQDSGSLLLLPGFWISQAASTDSFLSLSAHSLVFYMAVLVDNDEEYKTLKLRKSVFVYLLGYILDVTIMCP